MYFYNILQVESKQGEHFVCFSLFNEINMVIQALRLGIEDKCQAHLPSL